MRTRQATEERANNNGGNGAETSNPRPKPQHTARYLEEHGDGDEHHTPHDRVELPPAKGRALVNARVGRKNGTQQATATRATGTEAGTQTRKR
jgi:hypothetical protein